jgi:hypothetical protein
MFSYSVWCISATSCLKIVCSLSSILSNSPSHHILNTICPIYSLITGAFLYSRMPSLSPAGIETGKILIKQAGLDPMKFCKISNQCFIDQDPKSPEGRKKAQLQAQKDPKDQNTPFWYLGQNFFRATESIAGELADWFDDPAILSEWLVSQQVKMIQEQPFVSYFLLLQHVTSRFSLIVGFSSCFYSRYL